MHEISKYAFLGAQSVGKTTITNILKEKYQNQNEIVVLDEAARIFFEQNPHITDRSYKTQLAIQNFVLQREKAIIKPSTKVIISDRSVVDPIVLAQIWDPENAQKLFNNVADWLQTYTLFFILDLYGVPSKPDKFRKESPQERLAIQTAFIDFCIVNNLNYQLISGSLDQRVAKVEKKIKKSGRF